MSSFGQVRPWPQKVDESFPKDGYANEPDMISFSPIARCKLPDCSAYVQLLDSITFVCKSTIALSKKSPPTGQDAQCLNDHLQKFNGCKKAFEDSV